MVSKVIEIISKADDIVLDVYNNYETNIEYKTDATPLTQADTESSKYICVELSKLTPTIPIICEENSVPSYKIRSSWSIFWLVDPLDGTKEFIKKNGEFTVNIALISNNTPILGVVSVPCKELIYYGYKDGGAYVYNKNNNSQTKLVCKPFNKMDKITFACSRSHINDETEKYMNTYKIGDIVRVGSSLKFMLLCENKAHIYPRLGPTMEWDIAASDIILRESGGSIKLLNGNSMQYNKEHMLNPYFIAYGQIIN